MKKPPPATNFNFPLLLALFFSFALLFCACSEDPISFSYAQPYLVFDWENEEDPPKQRLGVFMSFSSNVRRLESFSVRNSNFTWNVEAPIMFLAGERQWAGSVHLEPPAALNGEAGLFSNGPYSVECVDAAGKSSQGSFSLGYNSALTEAKAAEAEGLLKAPIKKVAVYSESSELLYFDVEKPDWIDDKDIFRKVKNSSYFRRTLTAGNVVCFMPKIFKDGDKSDGLE